MSNVTISGNIGGAAGAGASVYATTLGGVARSMDTADANGNYTLSVPANAVYKVVGHLAGKVVRSMRLVTVAAANISNVNI